jgi:hypothetical protein
MPSSAKGGERMESYEVLRDAVGGVGVKSVAVDMGLSSAMVYRWCEDSKPDDASGAKNPLDRLSMIYELTQDSRPIEWLCQQANGFFVQNPVAQSTFSSPVFEATQRMLKEFSDVLQGVNSSMKDDGKIDGDEAAKLRSEWEDLKSIAESFIIACERGKYEE